MNISLEKDLREKIIALKSQGVPVVEIARQTGAQQSCLSNFMRGKASLSLRTVEKLWPFLYGEQPKQAAGE